MFTVAGHSQVNRQPRTHSCARSLAEPSLGGECESACHCVRQFECRDCKMRCGLV